MELSRCGINTSNSKNDVEPDDGKETKLLGRSGRTWAHAELSRMALAKNL